MTTKPRRQNIKPPGKCIFCLGGAASGNPMTPEHMWSDWMDRADLLPKGGEYVEFKNIARGRRRVSVRMFTRTRQGSANTKRIKVVCKNCNSGWMSQLETAARPILIPLIRGERFTLTAPMVLPLMRWITLKMFVAEHNAYMGHPADPIFDQAARTEFKTNLVIPDLIRVWIGQQNSAKWITGLHRHASGLGITRTLPPPSPDYTRSPNIQTITWGIGKLLIYINATTDMALYPVFELQGLNPFVRFWPHGGEVINWPPRFWVNDEVIDGLANALDNFLISGAVSWQEDDPP
jgi:hypothetical protein